MASTESKTGSSNQPTKRKAPKLKDTPGSSYYKGTAQAEQAKESQKQNDKNEESLTTILSAEQRTDLIILLATITAAMRDNITSTFDAHATLSPSFKKAKAQSKKDNDTLNPDVDPATADVEALDRERKMLAAREKELSEAKMTELRDACVEWFDNWRTMMINRVGEVVKTEKDPQQQVKEKKSTIQAGKPKQSNQDRTIDPGAGGRSDEDDLGEALLRKLYPPVKSRLYDLEEEKRVMILHSMLLLLLSLEHYAAPGRVLLLYLTSSLNIPLSTLDEDEAKTARGLLEAAKHMSGDEETKKAAESNASSRKWKVGLASVAGAAIVGISGGLAAPLLAAGVGSVMGGLGLGATAAAGYLGTVAGSTVIVGSLFGAYGGRMTGQMMDSYAREVSDFAFIPVHPSKQNTIENQPQSTSNEEGKDKVKDEAASTDESEERRLRVTIGITGWLTEKEEVVKPWRVLGPSSEGFALRWELETLISLGNAIEAMVKSSAWSYAQKTVIAQTVFAELMPAMWPAGLAKMSRVVDNPFSVAKARAEKAGAVLADALINRAQGERPVNLIGYSMGARVIYSCLLTLAARRQFGLVDSVVLIGSPLPSDEKDWRVMRTVVAGRLVNVFSQNDYVLAYLYRTSSVQLGVAGLQKIQGVSGVENVDVSEAVSGHLRYRFLVGSILKKIGWEDIDLEAVAKEEKDLKQMDEEEARRTEELKKKLKIKREKDGKSTEGEPTEKEAEEEAQEMEKDVQEKTRWSLMQKGAEWLSLGSSGREKEKQEEEEKKKEEKKRGSKGYMSSVTSMAPSWSSWSKGGKDSKSGSQADAQGEKGDGADKKEAESAEVEEPKSEENKDEKSGGTKDEKSAEDDKSKEGQRSYLEIASGGYLGGKK